VLLSLQGTAPPAILALADGTVFTGNSIGAAGQTVGEVVFNTSMTGYQEILTDPSYCQQIVTLTYPHIGNYGVNAEDVESRRVFAAGLIVKDLALHASNFRQTQTLSAYLQAAGTVAIANIDTRQLTRHLRTHGAQNGCILALQAGQLADAASRQAAIEAARAAPSMAGWIWPVWSVRQSPTHGHTLNGLWVRAMASRPSPAFMWWPTTSASNPTSCACWRSAAASSRWCPRKPARPTCWRMQPDGIFLSNGPGDPQPCDYAIAAAHTLIASGTPTFGICLGHQIMALASGAKTFKMKFGHHGANHPVKDLDSGRVSITSQNHGFAVDASSLPPICAPRTSACLTARCRAGAHGQAGVLLPGPPRSLARPARHWLPV